MRRKRTRNAVMLAVAIVSAGITTNANAVAFTSGNLAVFKATASGSNTTGSIVEVNASGGLAQTIAIDGATTPNELRFSGSAASTAYLSLSADRSLLTFMGANNTDTVANVNTLNPRGVGTLNNAGAFNLATTYTGTSGQQTRAATTLDNTNFYIADQAGLYTNSSTSASPAGNFRDIKSFGGVVYGSTASTTAPPVGTFSATTGSTYTGLPGLANGTAQFQDFYLVQSGSNGSTYDELYTLTTSSATVGTIAKFSLVSGSWTANGTALTGVGGFGLAAKANGAGGADIYFTTGTGATTANLLDKVTDSAGFNTGIALGTVSTLYTTDAGTLLKGVEFVPAPVPEPAALSLIGLSAFGLLTGRRRSNKRA